MSEAMSAQIPRLIVETSKVVQAQIQSDSQDSARSFTAFSQEMKKMKLRQEEVESTAKAAALKTKGLWVWLEQHFSFIVISFTLFFSYKNMLSRSGPLEKKEIATNKITTMFLYFGKSEPQHGS